MTRDTTEVVLALVVLGLALAAGLLTGGRLDGLGRLSLRRSALVVVGVLVQLVGAMLGGPFYRLGLLVSAGLLALFLLANRAIPGIGLVTLGLLANALVVGVNGAMPVSAVALGQTGASTQGLLTGADPRHELADGTTHLRALGDVIPVLLPLRAEVVSPGDVLVASGLAQLVVIGMRRRTAAADPR